MTKLEEAVEKRDIKYSLFLLALWHAIQKAKEIEDES